MLGGTKTGFISALEHTGADHISGGEPMDNPMKTILFTSKFGCEKATKKYDECGVNEPYRLKKVSS
jgi:hypothetical protein